MKKKIYQAKNNLCFEKIQNICKYMGVFIYLLYSFNISFRPIFLEKSIYLFVYLLAIVTLIVVGNFRDIKSNYGKNFKVNLFITLFLVIITVRNRDILNLHPGKYAYMLVSFFVMWVLSVSADKKMLKFIVNVILLLSLEHILATILFYFTPNLYFSKILPVLGHDTWTYNELLYEFRMKRIAGITSHYSTNVLYLSIGLITSTCYLTIDFKRDSKKSIINIMYILLCILAILLTGKRFVLIILPFSIIMVLIIKNLKIIKRIITRIIICLFSIILLVYIMHFFIPTITQGFERSIIKLKDGTIFDSRKVLYNVALDGFKENPIIGNGWASYRYIYQDTQDIVKEKDQLETHCIYLQLLCETGILGFMLFAFVMFYILVFSIKKLLHNNKDVLYSYFLMFYIFFLMEGIFGNSIYDVQLYYPFYAVLGVYISINSDDISNYSLILKKNS